MSAAFDYIIIGAGSAGCVLANRLTEDPGVSVLLLEAGGWDRSPYISLPLAWGRMFAGRMFDWGYDTMPEPHLDGRVLDCARGKVVGGSSSVNAMAYGRGHRADYDGWAEMGLDGWSWDDVLPFFRRAETWEKGGDDWRGGHGPMRTSEVPIEDPLTDAVFAAARDMQMPVTEDTNGAVQEGFHVPQFSIGDGRRSSTARAYLRPALRRPGLTVQTGAMVDRITFDGMRARGVRYAAGGDPVEARARREVILSAGSINSPQVLVRSGIGDSEHLRALGIETVRDAPGVGRNLQDHVNVAHEVVRRDTGLLQHNLRYDRFARLVAEALVLRRGLATKLPMGVIGFLKSPHAGEACDLTFLVRQSPPAPAQYWPWQDPGPDGIGYRVAMLQPKSRGEIRVVSTDPAAAPEIYQNLLSDPQDREVARYAMRLVGRINSHPALAPHAGEEVGIAIEGASEAEIDAHVRRTANTVHHPVGTVKMGPESDEMAVLDARCRVRGVEGLRVIDASVMPRIVTGPTNGPTIMIAERAAAFLRQERAA